MTNWGGGGGRTVYNVPLVCELTGGIVKGRENC